MAIKKLPKGLGRGKCGSVSVEGVYRLARKIMKQTVTVKPRRVGVVMDHEGSVYAVLDEALSFQRVIHGQKHLVVGTYTFESDQVQIKEDLVAQKKLLSIE